MMILQLWVSTLPESTWLPTIVLISGDPSITSLPAEVKEFVIINAAGDAKVSIFRAKDDRLDMVTARMISSLLSGTDIIPLASTSSTGITSQSLSTRDGFLVK